MWNKRVLNIEDILEWQLHRLSQHFCPKKRKRDKREIYDGDTREETTQKKSTITLDFQNFFEVEKEEKDRPNI